MYSGQDKFERAFKDKNLLVIWPHNFNEFNTDRIGLIVILPELLREEVDTIHYDLNKYLSNYFKEKYNTYEPDTILDEE